MPAKHPQVEVVAGDIYLHDFNFQNADGTPIIVTGNTYSVKVTLEWDGAEIDCNATAVVLDGPGGVVRVQILAADTLTLFDTPGAIVVRLRNDTLQTTLLTYELIEDR
jgi:hypothetical protein